VGWISDVVQDLRYGLRSLRKTPGFAAAAILTLALGIGANTAIFTLFNALLLDTLPVRDPDRLVLFSGSLSEGTKTGSAPQGRWELFSTEVYDFLRTQPLPFESLGAARSGNSTISIRLPGGTDASAQLGQAHLVSGNYFTVMGVGAAVGRTLTPGDDRPDAPPVAVVSDGFWRRRLAANPAVIGSTAILNGTAVTIVGVAPREFFGERVRRPPDFWVPLAFQPQIELRPSYLTRRDAFWLRLIGRLHSTTARAPTQTATSAALRQYLTNQAGERLDDERRREIQEARVELVDGAGGISILRQSYSQPLRTLLAVVGMVLVIACANVGGLLMARSAARHEEMAVRLALGAGRARLVRQLLTESLLLAALGAGCGLGMVQLVIDGLLGLIVSTTSPVHATVSWPILAGTIALTVIAGLLFGLAPALSAGRIDLQSAIKTGGRGGSGARRRVLGLSEPLVVCQIAVSLVLLVGANLFARSLINLQGRPLGFDQDHVLLLRLNPRPAGYSPETVGNLYRAIYDRVSALPGVRSATFARYSPLSGGSSMNAGNIEGYVPKPGEDLSFETIQVGPAYAETLGMQLLQGRGLDVRDTAGAAKAALVNDAFVRQFFADGRGVGRRFGYNTKDPAYEIVGVLNDAQFHNVRDDVKPIVFPAMLQERSQFALDCELAIRTIGDAAAVSNQVRQAIAEIDRNLPISDTRTLRSQVTATFDSQRLAAQLVGFFGALALLLASIGLYGVLAHAVHRRTREIGVRMALGAQRGDVVWMILRDTLLLLVVGLVLGVGLALGGLRFVQNQLFGLGAADPVSFVLAAITLTAVAVMTGLLPARRATRVDPLIAVKAE
jgi:predicted permease